MWETPFVISLLFNESRKFMEGGITADNSAGDGKSFPIPVVMGGAGNGAATVWVVVKVGELKSKLLKLGVKGDIIIAGKTPWSEGGEAANNEVKAVWS